MRLILLACLFLVSTAAAQQSLGGSCCAEHDTTYARLVREATSDPKFLPSSVATLPFNAAVPSPRAHFGTIAGAPGVMHHTAELYGYFRALARATPNVRVETLGTTEEGREIIAVVIADEATLRDVARYKAAAARLADPRALSAVELERTLAEAKPIYYLNGGLHSPEMGSPEMLLELAYRLAVSDAPEIQKIRQRVITVINPVSEPDGRDKQVDWYRRFTKGRAQYDDGFPRDPPYWGRYVVHDNNRDGIQITQALTRAINRAYFEWHPIVMHDLHESVPLLYISTGTGPYNETNDPLLISEWQLFANHDVTTLTAQGLPGVWTWGFFDGWWPGYAMWVANNHNAIGRFYETFGNAGADTYVRDLSTSRFAGELVTSRQWYRAWPPTRKVRWGARDNVNYMQAGVLASLGFTADNGATLLRNFWQKGRNSIERGRTQAPYAYVIPDPLRQRDPARAAYLVNQLRRHGIEVHKRTTADSGSAAAVGDYVVRLDQPYRDLAVNLLGVQRFPATAQYPPYDDIAWTLGLAYGVETKAIDDAAALRWSGLELVRDSVTPTVAVRGTGAVHILRYRAHGHLLSALSWLATRRGVRASALERAVVVGSDSFPVGSVVFEGLGAQLATQVASRFALPLIAVGAVPDAPRHALDLPRVAIYHTWTDTQDEGWARYTFEQYGAPYTSINKEDLRRGGLRSRFDVILVPRTLGELTDLIHEFDRKHGPMPYQKSQQTPHLGVPFSTADMTGGMGFEGLAALERFVDEGGTLITLANSTRLVGQTGIAPGMSMMAPRTLFHPGSFVRARARRTASPILYGYDGTTHLFRGNGPLFEVPRRDSGWVVLQYGTRLREEPKDEVPMLGITPAPTTPAPAVAAAPRAAAARDTTGGDYVLSGMVRAQEEIVGQAAIFDIPRGKGRIIAFTFDPLHRFLNHHDMPMVWNAIMNWNDH